jgi:hypothetical protein
MKIANIIYEKELVDHINVKYINYFNEPIEYVKLEELFQQSENYSHLMPSQSYELLPTLYIGWSFLKTCNPNNVLIQNVNILKKEIIINELFWEYSFEENKKAYVQGINNFINSIPEFYFQSRYTYVNLNPIYFQIIDIEGLMDVIPKKIDVSYNFKNEILYILFNNKISEINLKVYKYFNFNVEEIIKRIQERTETPYIDLEGILYQEQSKIFPNFSHLKRYLIVILSN